MFSTLNSPSDVELAHELCNLTKLNGFDWNFNEETSEDRDVTSLRCGTGISRTGTLSVIGSEMKRVTTVMKIENKWKNFHSLTQEGIVKDFTDECINFFREENLFSVGSSRFVSAIVSARITKFASQLMSEMRCYFWITCRKTKNWDHVTKIIGSGFIFTWRQIWRKRIIWMWTRCGLMGGEQVVAMKIVIMENLCYQFAILANDVVSAAPPTMTKSRRRA